MPERPGMTTDHTIRRAPARGGFHPLVAGPGEPVVVRADLLATPPRPTETSTSASTGPSTSVGTGPSTSSETSTGPSASAGTETSASAGTETSGGTSSGRVLARLIHLTDFQLADLSSPARLEYLQRFAGQPRWAEMLPSYRPQEFTATTLVEAMARTVRELAEAERPADLVITTGDNLDSAQRNELADFLGLMSGGASVRPLGAAPEVVTSALAAAGEEVPDWARLPGAPRYPGALDSWARPFVSSGVGAPWLACYGNHDALVQGRVRPTAELDRLASGDAKPVDRANPANRANPSTPANPADPADEWTSAGNGRAIDAYLRDPMCYCATDTVPVPADVRRRAASRAEFVRAQPSAAEAGDRAYWAHQVNPALTVLVLDTTNPGGYANGSIGAEQLRWLVEQLVAAHSAYLDEDGRWVHTARPDRAVVLCSHHGLSTLSNDHVQRDDAGHPLPGQDLPRSLAVEVAAVLERFPNVVLWLSGHIHRNQVRPVRTATGGYWSVATSALIDWPCQARCLELRLAGNTLHIHCRQLDHQAAITPEDEADPVLAMASLGRGLAANVFDGVGGADAEGTALDRNVELLVPLTEALAASIRATEAERAGTLGGSV